MKILILSNYANGLFLFRKEVISSFIQKGAEVLISVPFDENCAKLENLGARIVSCNLERRGMNPVKDLKLLKQYQALLKTEVPDLILTYTIKPNLYGGIAARGCRIPYAMNITGLGTALENPGFLGKYYYFYTDMLPQKPCVYSSKMKEICNLCKSIKSHYKTLIYFQAPASI